MLSISSACAVLPLYGTPLTPRVSLNVEVVGVSRTDEGFKLHNCHYRTEATRLSRQEQSDVTHC